LALSAAWPASFSKASTSGNDLLVDQLLGEVEHAGLAAEARLAPSRTARA
jgi:hypothetical protein